MLLARGNIKFSELTEEQRVDEDLALKVVNKNGLQLRYFTSEKIKSNKNIVLEAMKNNICAFKYASNKVKNDEEITLFAVEKRGINLKYAPKKYQDNKDIVMKAVSNDEQALKYASDRLKNDKDIITAAYDNPYKAYYNEGYYDEKVPTKVLGKEIKDKYFKGLDEVVRRDLLKTVKAISKETIKEKPITERTSKRTRSRIKNRGQER